MSAIASSPNDFSAIPDPRAADFFRSALAGRGLAHAYLFCGARMEPLYQTALLLAKILNCQRRPSPQAACGECLNCRWTAENAHPSVLTVSPLTHLDSKTLEKVEKGGKPPTQILAEQTARLLSEILLTASDHRVLIFVHAEALPGDAPEGTPPAPGEWRAAKAAQSRWFKLRPLTRAILNESSANRMLKTLEEPPAKTLFLFLTDSPDSLLETIVSRCQTLRFTLPPDVYAEADSPQDARRALDWLAGCQTRASILDCVRAFESALVAEAGMTAPQALALCQRALRDQQREAWRLGGDDPLTLESGYSRYRAFQRALEEAQRFLDARAGAPQTLLALARRLHQACV